MQAYQPETEEGKINVSVLVVNLLVVSFSVSHSLWSQYNCAYKFSIGKACMNTYAQKHLFLLDFLNKSMISF